MQQYILLLQRCLGEVVRDRAIVLVMDMASCHIHRAVLTTAMAQGVRVVLVPAGATHLLQPLDTHVFRQFRSKMRCLWLECRSASGDGQVPLQAWLELVCQAIQEVVVAKSWQHAFERDGILSQSHLSPKILRALEWGSCPEVPATLPAVGQASTLQSGCSGWQMRLTGRSAR